MVHGLRIALAASAIFLWSDLRQGRGATVSTNLTGFKANPDHPFLLETTFDLEIGFKLIDSVKFEVTMPEGLVAVETGDPGHIKFSSLVLSIYDPAVWPVTLATIAEASFPNTIMASASSIAPGTPTLIDARMSSLFGARPWPSYFLAGRGAVLMHIEDIEFWGVGGVSEALRTADGVSSVRLVVNGIAVPEPTSAALALASLILMTARKRRTALFATKV